jgi:hypothetical protein
MKLVECYIIKNCVAWEHCQIFSSIGNAFHFYHVLWMCLYLHIFFLKKSYKTSWILKTVFCIALKILNLIMELVFINLYLSWLCVMSVFVIKMNCNKIWENEVIHRICLWFTSLVHNLNNVLTFAHFLCIFCYLGWHFHLNVHTFSENWS